MPKVVLCVRVGVHSLGIDRGIRLTMAEISKSTFTKSLFEIEQQLEIGQYSKETDGYSIYILN